MRFLRILLVVLLAAGIAGVVVPKASALGFEDEPCPLTDPVNHQLKVCHPDAVLGKPYSLQIKGKGGCTPDFVKYSIVGGTFPPGLQINSGTALVTGIPTQAGTFTFWLQVSDEPQSWCVDSKQSQWQFELTVDAGIQIVQRQSSLTPGQIGQAYNMQFSATGGTVTGWSVASGSLPAGLTLNTSNGLLSGTPTTAGDYHFQISATNGTVSDTQTYAMSVVQPLKITAPAATPAEVNRPFNVTLTASGGKQGYTWSIASGSTLPAGLTLDAAKGTITGTPTAAGGGTVKVTVTDALGLTNTVDLNLSVADQLTLVKRPLRTAHIGTTYHARLVAQGGVTPMRFRIIRGSLPSGIRLNASTGALSGTATQSGTARITVRVRDALGAISTMTYVLRVR